MKTASMIKIEEEWGKPIEQILIDEFNQHGNQADVAAALGITQGTVSLWCLRLGLQQRTVLVSGAESA